MSKKHKHKHKYNQPPQKSGKERAEGTGSVPSQASGSGAPGAAKASQAAAQPQSSDARQSVAMPRDPSPVVSLLAMAPIISRSGRPFDDQAGPDGARVPPPSSVAGCLRTAWARQEGKDLGPKLVKHQVDELLGHEVRGPLLARPAPDGTLHLLVPRPADALYFGAKGAQRCVRAAPQPFEDGSGADLPDDLMPVQLREPPDGKETKGRAWWAWEHLVAFREGADLSFKDLDEEGWSPPAGERRTHVAIEAKTYAAKTGQLFQTEGLDFSPTEGLKDDPESDLRLLVRFDQPLGAAMAHLGGERRLARIEPRDASAWPKMPEDWLADIRTAGGLCLTLLTPGLFEGGYRPGWLKPGQDQNNLNRLIGSPPGMDGLKLALRAAALGRWQPHSGWDLAAQMPRPGRKLVPAGAVYWFALIEPEAVRDEDLNALWLASLCDHQQDRRDGFGLALPAPWAPVENSNPTNSPE